MKSKRGLLLILLTIMLVISITTPASTSHALTPRVMLSEYNLSSDEIYPGDTFTLSFKLKNTSKNTVMNLKCTIKAENGEFLPADGVGSMYVSEIKGGEEAELSIDLTATGKFEEKSYKIIIKTEYEDWSKSYTVEDNVYVPMKLKTEVVVSETYIAEEEIRLGDNIEIISTINNVGAADIYKVMAKCSGDNIADGSAFIGNIASGKTGSIDIITKATAVKHPDTGDNKVEITYEDKDGNVYSETIKLGKNGVIEVMEQDYSDIIQVKEDNTHHLTDMDKLLIIGAAVVVLLVIIIVSRAAKRKRLEREFD